MKYLEKEALAIVGEPSQVVGEGGSRTCSVRKEGGHEVEGASAGLWALVAAEEAVVRLIPYNNKR